MDSHQRDMRSWLTPFLYSPVHQRVCRAKTAEWSIRGGCDPRCFQARAQGARAELRGFQRLIGTFTEHLRSPRDMTFSRQPPE
jgi:hypothetical protein